MTEATDKGGSGTEILQSAGAQLKRARESRNLTIQQVAQALHLDAWILEALEQDRFKDVGAPVFVKGHLRKYAAEVGLDGQQLMEAYYRADDTPETPGLVTDTFSRPGRDEKGRWPIIVVSGVIALLVVLVVFLWLRDGNPLSLLGLGSSDEAVASSNTAELLAADETRRDTNRTAEVGIPVADASADGGADESTDAAESETGADEQSSEIRGGLDIQADDTLSVTLPPEAVQDAADDGLIRVSITLQNDSWVEIYDASNRRLYFDLARAGAATNVSGEAPLQVLLGNADDARVRVDGEVWPIPAAARRGKTARFTIR